MDYSYIDKLLERYWQCGTSQEEEEMLKAFFRQKSIPQRFEPYRSLFNYEDGNAAQHSFNNNGTTAPDYNYATYKDTYEDPQVAYDKVSSALKDMSDGLRQQVREDSAARIDNTKSVQ